MATIKGESGLLYIYDNTNSIYKPVACLTSCSFTPSRSVIESNTKCYPGVTKKQAGQFNCQLSADGEYIDTTSIGGDTAKASHDYLFDIIQGSAIVDWKYDTGVTGAVYYGKGVLTELPLDQGAGDELSTFSLTIDVDGSVSKTDPNA